MGSLVLTEDFKISADDRGIPNASYENPTPCVFPSQVWHQLIFPEAVSTGHSIYNAYVIKDHVYLDVTLSLFLVPVNASMTKLWRH